MGMNIKDDEAHRMARELARLTGQSLTNAVKSALGHELRRARAKRGLGRPLVERLTEISDHCASLPDLDTRSPDEIIGYDENGVPR